MPEEVQHCPLCGESGFTNFDLRQFHGYSVTNVTCTHCGLVYQSPRMTEVESQAFYESEYRLLYQGQPGPNPKDMVVQTLRAQVALDFIHAKVKSADEILDIGCSTGILLHQFKEHFQGRVAGIEPGIVYRQYAQSTGLQVYGSLEELNGTGAPRFDLVCLMHVLEHLPHPVKYLQVLKDQYLKDDGWLLLEVPNLYAHDSFELAHLVSYSAHTLEQAVMKAGFTPVKLRLHGLPRSHLIPLYLTLLAQPGDNSDIPVSPERLVSTKRKLGLIKRRLAERFFPQRAWLPTE